MIFTVAQQQQQIEHEKSGILRETRRRQNKHIRFVDSKCMLWKLK